MDVDAIKKYYLDEKRYAYWRNYHLRRWAMVLPYLNGVTSLLDVGCGFGDLAWNLTENEMHPKYTGIDLVPEHVSFAKQTMPHDEWILGDFFDYDFKGRKWDCVVTVGFLSGDGWLSGDAKRLIDKMCSVSARMIVMMENQTVFFPEIMAEIVKRKFRALSTDFGEIIVMSGAPELEYGQQQYVDPRTL